MPASGNNTKTVVVDLKLMPNDTVKTIQDLQTKIANLKQVMEGMRAQGMQNTETYIKLQATLKELEQGVRANQKVLRDSIRENQKNGDSINALRATVRNLRSEYENLSKAERESAKGQDMLQHIHDLTAELKTLEEQQLDFARNVGNYRSALEGLPFGRLVAGFNTLSQGTGKLSVAIKNGALMVKTLGKEFLALLANPIVAGIAAITAVVMKLTNSIKKNDEAMTALKSLMASLQPILNIIEKGFQAIVGVITKAINGISAFIQKVMQLVPGLREYSKANEDVVRSADALEDKEREYTLNNAKRQKEISELRNKAVQSDKYSANERKKFLQQAMDLEKEDLGEKRDIAAERYRIAKEEALLSIGVTEMTQEAWAKLSDEAKNHLTDLEAAMVLAEKEYNDGTRRMQSQISTLSNTGASTRKERLKNEREALKELENTLTQSIKNIYDKETATVTASYNQQINALKEKLNTEKNLTKAAKQYINQQIVLLESDLQLKLGDIRERRDKEQWQKQLENTKSYYTRLLSNLSTEDARVQVRLEINDLDTKLLKAQLQTVVDDARAVFNQAQTDLEGDVEKGLPSLDYNELALKYSKVWEAYGIVTGDNISKMRQLVAIYQSDMEKAEAEYQNNLLQIDQAAANERLRIQKTSQDNQWNLAVKHQEILSQIQGAKDLDQYRFNEVEKTRILAEQAEERLNVARTEHQRMADERAKYTDNELTALYGSVEEYNLKFAESELKVVEAEVAVKDALLAVDQANTQVKAKMINTATAVMGAMNQVVGSIGDVFNTLAESDEKYEGWALAMAELQILISTAISIAQAIQGAITAAAQTGIAAPFTTPVFIAEMVGIVVGAIASATTTLLKAKQSKQSAPKFAEGGLIGNKTTRRKDDTVTAKLTLGEYVIPAPVVDDLGIEFFDQIIGKNRKKLPKIGNFETPHFATGGLVNVPNTQSIMQNFEFDYDMLREVVGEALAGMPAPVVSVKEVTNAQKRVQVKEQLAHF